MILYAVFFLLISLVCLIAYNKMSTGKDNSYTCLVGKTAIITGANTGIGFWTALDFAKRGARVILACRNLEKAREAQRRIIKETDNDNVIVKHLDLASLKSVQKFANDIIRTNENVHILVNNAGTLAIESERTEDNFEMTLQVNYFGGFLLTSLLIDTLKKCAPSRIVNVSSFVAQWTTVHANEIASLSSGKVIAKQNALYFKTKLCIALATIKLAEVLQDTGITVNALHPGVINTDMFLKGTKFLLRILQNFLQYIIKTAEEGAQTIIYVALSKEIDAVSGCFFSDCKKIKLYKTIDKQLADEIWKKTKELLAERGYSTFNRFE